jgi:dipeptidyl aminopeptidase/acylaminoacyl peptidase
MNLSRLVIRPSGVFGASDGKTAHASKTAPMLTRSWMIAFVLVIASTMAGVAARQTIRDDDYARLVELHSPVVSPDSKRAVVVVSHVAWDDDRYVSELVMIDLATRAQRILTYQRRGLSDPAFSPDGSRLAFIADDGTGDDARPQVFVMPLDGGDAKPVTHAKSGVEQFAWRPDGAALAFVATDPAPDRKGADRFRDSFIFTTEPIVARELPRAAHLYVVTLANGETTQLTFGLQSITTGEAESTLSWSPDGKVLAFTLAPDDVLNDESYSHAALFDVATRTLRPLTPHTAWEGDPLISPDGMHVAYGYSNGDNQVNLNQVYVTTPAGGSGEAVSASVDRTVADFAWARDSKSLYFSVPNATSLAIYRVVLGGKPVRLSLGNITAGVPGVTTGAVIASSLRDAIAADGTMVFIASSTEQPPELFKRAADGVVTKLTDFNSAIAGLQLASAERITFPTSMGITGDGVLYRPPDFVAGRKYPLVVYIHGGPTSSSTTAFDFWAQAMAARGWLVLRPNYRGSNNLGIAYQRAVLYDPEEGPGKDIMAAVDAVRAGGIVDDSRIAVCGWSYGGIMTAWMISKYHIWKAAVSGASVNDWTTDYGTADDSLADVDLFHGSPFVGNDAPEWRRASAISYVSDVTTPVLILSDVGDNRDSFATSSMYWRALRDNHKDATLRVWPIDGHFPSDPVRTVDVFHYWIDYIARHF